MKKLGLFLGLLMAAAPAARAGFQNAFSEGEDLTFAIRWGVITGGYATLSVPSIEPVGGRPAYHILSEAHSTGVVSAFYKVRDRNEAWLDAAWPRSLRYARKIQEGKYRVDEVVELDHAAGKFHLTEVRHDKNTREVKEGQIPPNVLDVFSSLYYVRTLPLEVGQSYTIDVHSGEKTWPLLVKVLKKERVKVKAGRFNCIKVEPVLREAGIFINKGKKMQVWLTDDERRMPVLMRAEVFIGHVSAELVRQKTPPPKDEQQKLAVHPLPLSPTSF